MNNCLFAFPDRVLPNSYVAPVLTGGSWLTALPLANLQDSSDTRLSTLARSTNVQPASTLIDIDLGTLRDLRVMAILRHNLSLTATIRFQFWTDTARTQLAYDTGTLLVWLPFYPAGSLPWGHPSLWDGKILQEDRDGYQFDFIRALPNQVVVRSVRVEISDTGNSDGYVELARCILAPAWQPPVNFIYGNTVGWESDATISKSLGGRRFINEQAKRRTAACTIEHLDPGIAMSSVMEMQRRLGMSGELIYVHDPTVTSQAEWQRSFLCNLEELSPIENPYFNANTAGFKLLEVL